MILCFDFRVQHQILVGIDMEHPPLVFLPQIPDATTKKGGLAKLMIIDLKQLVFDLLLLLVIR
jgi:hypothetical protein